MNYLAHAFLARHSDRAMVGALLGDFVKGGDDATYPADIATEIRLHRRIDSFTDAHPVVRASKQLFHPDRRRFAGIALDVFYDHVLSRRWSDYADVPREALIRRLYAALDQHRDLLPLRLRDMAPHMAAQDWLGSYHDLAGVERAVARISLRLSRNGDRLRDCALDLRAHYDDLAEGFGLFFPDLIRFAREERDRLEPAAECKTGGSSPTRP